MFVGTCSDAGKSVINAAFCRIFKQDGYQPAPFKAQNMSLNSYSTPEGGEMGRAQVVQAEACGISPHTDMNPILLKPTNDKSSQVVLNGKPVGNMSAKDYFGIQNQKEELFKEAIEAFKRLEARYNPIVLEGAGSISELNLRDRDITNMRMAIAAGASTYLVADIDRGGVFGSVYGTIALLRPEERVLMKGVIINKFRGDIKLLEPALTFIEEKTGKKVVGVIPAIENLDIDEEDSVALENKKNVGSKDIQIAVIQTPKISNFTDFDALNYEPDVSVRFIGSGDVIGTPDLIILPGSKNTLADLTYLKNSGLANEIKELAEKGTPVIGICGGNQMLGTAIYDPHHMEGDIEESEGLGLVNSTTTMKDQKTTHQVTFDVENLHFLNGTFSGSELVGYEIHMGDTTPNDDTVKRCFTITKRSEIPITVVDGFIDGRHQVMGTYIHGVFDNDEFRRFIINQLRLRKGLDETPVVFHYFEHKNNAYNRLADIVEEHLDMDYIMTLLKDNG